HRINESGTSRLRGLGQLRHNLDDVVAGRRDRGSHLRADRNSMGYRVTMALEWQEGFRSRVTFPFAVSAGRNGLRRLVSDYREELSCHVYLRARGDLAGISHVAARNRDRHIDPVGDRDLGNAG